MVSGCQLKAGPAARLNLKLSRLKLVAIAITEYSRNPVPVAGNSAMT